MAHSYVDARLQAHGYLLAHGMVSDKFLTIGTPSDNNNSIERTRMAHSSINARNTPHGWMLATSRLIPASGHRRLIDAC